MRTFFVAIGVFVLALILSALFLRFESRKAKETKAVETNARPEPVPKEVYDLETQMELKRMPLRREKGTALLDFTISIPRRCPIGDADAIKLDLDASPEKRILISVEPLDPADTSFKPQVEVVGPELLQTGRSVLFKVPLRERSIAMGVFVCKDSQKKGRCLGKPFEDLNAIFSEYSKAGGVLKNPPPDRTYFFQFLSIQKGESLVAFAPNIVKDDALRSVTKYLDATGTAGNGTVHRQQGELIKDLTLATRSLPVAFGSSLRVDLPLHDLNRCRPDLLRPDIGIPPTPKKK